MEDETRPVNADALGVRLMFRAASRHGVWRCHGCGGEGTVLMLGALWCEPCSLRFDPSSPRRPLDAKE